MALSPINKLYVSYVKQVERKLRTAEKPSKLNKKIYEWAINWLGKILLPSTERRKIRATCQEALNKKTLPNYLKPRGCKFKGDVCVTNLPPVNFLNVTSQPYPASLKSYESIPLCKAVLDNDLSQMKILLSDSTKKNLNKEKALQLAIYLGRLDGVKLFVESGYIKTEKRKKECLKQAIKKEHSAIVQYFLEQGVNLNSKQDKNSLLAYAFCEGNLESITKIITAGGQFKASTKDIEAIIYRLIALNNKQVSELFLTQVFKNSKYRQYEIPLLELAITCGMIDLLKELTKQGLNIKKYERKNPNSNRLIPSIAHGHLEIVEFLIQEGVRVEKGTKLSPLVEAAHRGSIPVAELLIKYGADINGIEMSAFTPLAAALARGHHELADFLIKNGASPLKAQLSITQKMLAHRFAVPGRLVMSGAPAKTNLEGASYGLAIQEFILSLTQFFEKPPSNAQDFPHLASQAKILNAMKELLANHGPAKTDEEVLANYVAGEMVALTSGWKKHATYRLLYKGFYIEVNRGMPVENGIESGYQIYRINGPLTSDLIKKMRQGESKTLEEVRKDRSTIHQELQLALIAKGKYRPQQGGTCAWDNLKAIFRMMLLVDQFEKNRLENKDNSYEWVAKAEKTSTQIYKLFTNEDREKAIKNALQLYQKNPVEPLPFSLLLTVLGKFKGDKKMALELATFLKQKDVKWTLKNHLGKGFIDYVRKSNNHSLIPLLAQNGIL